MKLTAEQTENCPFPIGCPVWYDFPEKPSSCGESEEPPILKQGVVESISFNLSAKDMIYEVVYENDDAGGKNGTIVEEISEHKLAFGANCPVTISNEDRSDEGTILLCEPSSSEPGKFLYTVMIVMEGSQARFESGVSAERIKFRKFKKEQVAIDDPPTIKMPPSVVPSVEATVPSSIICDAVSKTSSREGEGGSGSSKKRKHVPDNAFNLTPTSDSQYKQHRVDSNRNSDGEHWKGRGNGKATLQLKTPFWIQSYQAAQSKLFSHLNGPRHPDKRRKRTVKDIEREANCDIIVNFIDKGNQPGFRPPITITVHARSLSSGARDIHFAREKIQDLLLDFVQRDGSRGQLLYDIASSCEGDHRPAASRSVCVRAKDPFAEDGREVYMTVVHLPYEEVRGKKEFHVNFLLTSSLLSYLWKEMDCYVKAVSNESGIPTKLCWPYLLVMGESWHNVDRAVKELHEVMKKYVDRSSCKFNKRNKYMP